MTARILLTEDSLRLGWGLGGRAGRVAQGVFGGREWWPNLL